ncbi:MAG TPA: 16S rRNA (uracil(1498)-N(3))-methyltransferase, partial [Candidatus Polarisedimenticolaceae bacterium]|nr:16S rRNA (uracil(1498)-N(3))-methyltransferase [Candidatus Polarisedimenticolaceae bacterium]
RRWRVWHPGAQHAPGVELELDREQAHHVLQVLRLEPGTTISVFDGVGREWEATIRSADRAGVVVRLESELTHPVEPAVAVVLYQALCRAERVEWAVQKATELGVAAVRLWPAERSGVPRPDPRRLERWRRIAVEACKQSGRRRLPPVEAVDGLPPAAGPAWLLDPDPQAPRLGARLPASAPREVWVGVGPEAGLSAPELARARQEGWEPAGLGPRVLRTETAGVVAVALVLQRYGDLG